MGGGVLPVALHKGQLFFLFGEEADEHKWIDFGGGAKAHLPHLVCKNGLFEKRQIKWMTLEEIQQKRNQFRHYYRPMLDQILAHETFLKAEILQNFIQ